MMAHLKGLGDINLRNSEVMKESKIFILKYFFWAKTSEVFYEQVKYYIM